MVRTILPFRKSEKLDTRASSFQSFYSTCRAEVTRSQDHKSRRFCLQGQEVEACNSHLLSCRSTHSHCVRNCSPGALFPTTQRSDCYFFVFLFLWFYYITMLYPFKAQTKLRKFSSSHDFPAKTYKFCLATGDLLLLYTGLVWDCWAELPSARTREAIKYMADE